MRPPPLRRAAEDEELADAEEALAEEALAEELPHSRSCFAEPLAPADVRRVLAWRDKAAREFGAAHGPSEPFAGGLNGPAWGVG